LATAAALTALALALAGCKRSTGSAGREYPMGAQVQVGPLIYTVIHAEWLNSLDASQGMRSPKNSFLAVQLSITNSGAADAGVPLLTLEDPSGKTYLEEDKGDGLEGWMGLLRLIKPAQTEQGRILFDVPPGVYRLRVTTGGDPEAEVYAHVKLTLRADEQKDDTAVIPAKESESMAAPGKSMK
jgi:hypothetical protein